MRGEIENKCNEKRDTKRLNNYKNNKDQIWHENKLKSNAIDEIKKKSSSKRKKKEWWIDLI